MCGIVGYAGAEPALGIVLDGLRPWQGDLGLRHRDGPVGGDFDGLPLWLHGLWSVGKRVGGSLVGL